MFATLADFAPLRAVISLSMIMILVSSAGLVICLYALFALGEGAKYIRGNWDYAYRCVERIEGLRDSLSEESEEESWSSSNMESTAHCSFAIYCGICCHTSMGIDNIGQGGLHG
jgi:hypothetical protein